MKERGRPKPAPATPQTLTTKAAERRIATAVEQDGLPRCGLCDRHREPAWPGHPWCARCVRDLGEALDRRRAAELRLPPLDKAVA